MHTCVKIPLVWLGCLGLLALPACDSGPTNVPTQTTATGVTEFHISVFNACMDDVKVRVGASSGAGNDILLLRQRRDSFKGTTEAVWLLDRDGTPLAHYQPKSGRQKLKVTSDCTGLVPG
ncbi:MAG: hypothetical protein ACPG4T_13775 [Nannocystaceae bacterium]